MGDFRPRSRAGASRSSPSGCISQNIFNEHSGTVIAMAITGKSQRASFPLTFRLKDGTLPKPSWVKISQIRILSIKRIGQKIGNVSEAELDLLVAGLNEIIA